MSARARREGEGGAGPPLPRAGGGEPWPALRIRPARGTDLPRVLEVERASFSNPWSADSFRSLTHRDRVLFLVAEERGREGPEVVGHGVLWWVAREGELANLAVAAPARRRGVASRLLEDLLEGAGRAGVRAVFLEVRRSNREAILLYRSRGFRQVEIRRDYYTRPREDARIFRLDLPADRSPNRTLP